MPSCLARSTIASYNGLPSCRSCSERCRRSSVAFSGVGMHGLRARTDQPDDFDIGEDDEAVLDHRFDGFDGLPQFFFGVDKRNHEPKVTRKAQRAAFVRVAFADV